MPTATEDRLVRCAWIGNDPLMLEYHDHEWGVPVHDDRKLFEFIVLSGAQAGLNWRTILRRRDAYREAFAAFDPIRIARFDQRKIGSLLHNDRIIRNRLTIEEALQNPRAYVALRQKGPSLDEFMWEFVDGKPIVNHWRATAQIPAAPPESDTMSKQSKKDGI